MTKTRWFGAKSVAEGSTAESRRPAFRGLLSPDRALPVGKTGARPSHRFSPARFRRRRQLDRQPSPRRRPAALPPVDPDRCGRALGHAAGALQQRKRRRPSRPRSLTGPNPRATRSIFFTAKPCSPHPGEKAEHPYFYGNLRSPIVEFRSAIYIGREIRWGDLDSWPRPMARTPTDRPKTNRS